MRKVDCGGIPFSFALLEHLLDALNKDGELEITGIQPGSIRLMDFGMRLKDKINQAASEAKAETDEQYRGWKTN